MADPLFDEWRAYQKLLEHDYMYHAVFFDRLDKEIQKRFNYPVAILDLGCGDVSPMRPVLENRAISMYCGVDQSETALSIAGSTLAALGIPSRLITGDLLETLQTMTGSFDVIVASFSLHHLESVEAKQQVLEESRRVLNPSGMVAVIDVFQSGDDTREKYLQRWIDFARNNYLALDSVEMRSLVDHVTANDYPESMPTYRSIAGAAGFDSFEVLLRDKEHFNHLVALVDNSSFVD